MMIICCYTEITHQWNEQKRADKLLLLPVHLRQAILRKRHWIDVQLSIGGKLLLLEVLKQLGKQYFLLDNLKYNTHHRPYFESGIDFNIAHSDNIVMCSATDKGQIGCDIEQIHEIDLTEYADYFTPNEWDAINNCPNRFDGFYNFWTRKEAVLKAIGTGFHTPLSSVDVSAAEMEYDEITYYIQPLRLADGYKSHLATTIKPKDIRVIKVNL